MAGVRHAFISGDGRATPEWQTVSRQARFVAAGSIGEGGVAGCDLAWIHASASGDPGKGYVELVRRLAPTVPCVVLADVPEDLDALACFAAGARGYCNSHANARILKLVTEVVMRGGLWIGKSLMQRVISGLSQASPAPPAAAGTAGTAPLMALLSPREREVAEAIAAGASNKVVARQLGISERTVKAHVSTIFHKLDVKDRLQLAVKIIGLRK